MKKVLGIVVSALLAIMMSGCGIQKEEAGDFRAIDYTVLKTAEIPEEVMELIQNQGEKAFQMVYKSDGWLYVMRGYGEQKTGGYSIRVLEVGAAGELLRVRSELIGPQTKEEQKGDSSSPYFVLKLEDQGYPVMFEEAGGEVDGVSEEKSASDQQKK